VPAVVSPQTSCFADGGGCNINSDCCSSICSNGVCGTAPDIAPSAVDGFDPNANGTIRAVVVQPDGKILIGGDFTTLSPNGLNAIPRNHIARLNPDGTVDAAFNPNANNSVFAIAVQADGKILAGGLFTSVRGQTHNFLARLDPTTGAPDSFNPNPTSDVMAIAVQTDGKILVGGDFSSIGGQPRLCIARLDPITGLADSFNPNSSSTVDAIVVLADGRIVVGGDFSGFNCIGGQTRNFIARLNATTGLADSFNPNANDQVNTIAVQADGRILAGGFFSGIGGQTRNRIARLNSISGLADSFNPNANGTVNSIAVQADGKILVGGGFTTLQPTGAVNATTRNRIARVNADGTLDGTLVTDFNPNANGNLNAIAVQADGKILAGGQFSMLTPNGGAAVTRNHIARLNPGGTLDQTLNLNLDSAGFVYAIALQPDGKILIGGAFTSVLGVPRSRLARLSTDGTLDTAFDPNVNGDVRSIAVQADGKILVGGFFSTLSPNGGATVTRHSIARLNSDGTLDGTLVTDFNPNANGGLNAIAVQADGKILLGGDFTTLQPNGAVNATTRNRIARVNQDGTLDTVFDPNANNAVNSIVAQADGKILVGGDFQPPDNFDPPFPSPTPGIGGQYYSGIARLDATTGAADSFNPNPDYFDHFVYPVSSIAVQADGNILVGGSFSFFGGEGRNDIARLNPITGAADSFNPNADFFVDTIAVQADGKILIGGEFSTLSPNNGPTVTRREIARVKPDGTLDTAFDANASSSHDPTIFSIAVQTDGKILAGGTFNSIGGQARNDFARLSNDTAALQNLTVTQTAITWTRGGSSPHFNRVTFESSTDNVTYTLLGSGIPLSGSSNWILSGLNLPAGQNIYIRARGYYSSGRDNGSESIAESVRNAFIAPALKITSIARPANGHAILQCLGVPNQVNDLQVSPDLSPGSFVIVSPLPAAADGTGAFSYDDAGAVGLTKRFYRLAFP
jgi:uncharacterized delta-60 repeat protein